jgi:hypothetical protein
MAISGVSFVVRHTWLKISQGSVLAELSVETTVMSLDVQGCQRKQSSEKNDMDFTVKVLLKKNRLIKK